jgi:hypothetical protein
MQTIRYAFTKAWLLHFFHRERIFISNLATARRLNTPQAALLSQAAHLLHDTALSKVCKKSQHCHYVGTF